MSTDDADSGTFAWARRTRAPRIFVFDEDPSRANAARARLAADGFEVTSAQTLLAAARVLALGGTDLCLIYLPRTEWLRYAVLTEARRTRPTLPVVAVAAVVSEDLSLALARFNLVRVLSAEDGWGSTLEVVRGLLCPTD